MDFFELEEYTKKDIDDLIQNEVEESIYLDYKDGRALDPDKIAEITKDVSAFANADGGIIVYGVSENKATHKPEGYATVTNPKITKEWLEQKISLIRRKIDGVLIFPIRLEGNPNDSIYVVKIPRSNNAPHMALDNKYYKRHNFSSDPMEEYEVREAFNRASIPNLEITGCSLYKSEESENSVTFDLMASIANEGHQACESYKLNFYINDPFICDISYKVLEENHSYTILNKHRLKLGAPSQEPIYPGEELNIGHFQITVKKENMQRFWNGLVIDMILFYSGGHKDLAFVPSTKEYIDEREDIDKLLEQKCQEIDETTTEENVGEE